MRTDQNDTIRLMIVDDHLLFRQGLTKIFESTPDIKIVGEASGGRQAINDFPRVKPNVLLLDVDMPGMDGFEVCRTIKTSNPNVKCEIIILTVENCLENKFSSQGAGASAYLTKNAASEELIETIRKVYHEGSLLRPDSLRNLESKRSKKAYHVSDPTVEKEGLELFSSLSKREKEILYHVSQGKHNKDIASELHISEHTVRNHISNIFQKLQVNDRTQASVLALKSNTGIIYATSAINAG